MELSKNNYLTNDEDNRSIDVVVSQFYVAINNSDISNLDKTWNSIRSAITRESLLTLEDYKIFRLAVTKGYDKVIKWLWIRVWEFGHTLPISVLYEIFQLAFNYDHPKIISFLFNQVEDKEKVNIILRFFDPSLESQHYYYNDFLKAFYSNKYVLLRNLHEEMEKISDDLNSDIIGDMVDTIDIISKHMLYYRVIYDIKTLQEVYNIAKLIDRDTVLFNSVSSFLKNLADEVVWQELVLKAAMSEVTTEFLNLHFLFDQLKFSNISSAKVKAVFNYVFQTNHCEIFRISIKQRRKDVLETLWNEVENARNISFTDNDILKLKARILRANGYNIFHKSISQNLPSILEWLIDRFDPVSGMIKGSSREILEVTLQNMFNSKSILINDQARNNSYYLKKYGSYHIAVINGYTKIVNLLFNKAISNELRKDLLQSNITVTKAGAYIATIVRPYSAFHQAITINNKKMVEILVHQAKELGVLEEMLTSDDYSAFPTAVILRDKDINAFSTALFLGKIDMVGYLWTMSSLDEEKVVKYRKRILNALIQKLEKPGFINFSTNASLGTLREWLNDINKEYRNHKDEIYQQIDIILSAFSINFNPKTLQDTFLSFLFAKTLIFPQTYVKLSSEIPLIIKNYKLLQEKILSRNIYDNQRIFKHALYFPVIEELGISIQIIAKKITVAYSIMFFQKKDGKELSELFLNKLETVIDIFYNLKIKFDPAKTIGLNAKEKAAVIEFDRLLTEIYSKAVFEHVKAQKIENIENKLLELKKHYTEYSSGMLKYELALYLTSESGELLAIYYKDQLYHVFISQYGVIYSLSLEQVKSLIKSISTKFEVTTLYCNPQYYVTDSQIEKLWQPIIRDKKILIEIGIVKIELDILDDMGARLYKGVADKVGTPIIQVHNLQTKLLLPDNKVLLDPKKYLKVLSESSIEEKIKITFATNNLGFIKGENLGVIKEAKKKQAIFKNIEEHFKQLDPSYYTKKPEGLLDLLQSTLFKSYSFNIEELLLITEYVLNIESDNIYVSTANIVNTRPINLASTSSGRGMLVKNLIDIADAVRQGDRLGAYLGTISLGLSIRADNIEEKVLRQFDLLYSNKKFKVKIVKGGVAALVDFTNIIDIFKAIKVLRTAKLGSMEFRDSIFSMSFSGVSITTAVTVSLMPKVVAAKIGWPITFLFIFIQSGYGAYSVSAEYNSRYNLTSEEIFFLASKKFFTLNLADITEDVKNIEAWSQRLDKITDHIINYLEKKSNLAAYIIGIGNNKFMESNSTYGERLIENVQNMDLIIERIANKTTVILPWIYEFMKLFGIGTSMFTTPLIESIPNPKVNVWNSWVSVIHLDKPMSSNLKGRLSRYTPKLSPKYSDKLKILCAPTIDSTKDHECHRSSINSQQDDTEYYCYNAIMIVNKTHMSQAVINTKDKPKAIFDMRNTYIGRVKPFSFNKYDNIYLLGKGSLTDSAFVTKKLKTNPCIHDLILTKNAPPIVSRARSLKKVLGLVIYGGANNSNHFTFTDSEISVFLRTFNSANNIIDLSNLKSKNIEIFSTRMSMISETNAVKKVDVVKKSKVDIINIINITGDNNKTNQVFITDINNIIGRDDFSEKFNCQNMPRRVLINSRGSSSLSDPDKLIDCKAAILAPNIYISGNISDGTYYVTKNISNGTAVISLDKDLLTVSQKNNNIKVTFLGSSLLPNSK